MNKVASDAGRYLSHFIERCSESLTAPSDIIFSPPFTALGTLSHLLKSKQSQIGLAAQNLYFENAGAYTGEVSAEMLCEIGCTYAIIGHSERRNLFGETDEVVHRKLVAARKAGLIPILCVGETLADWKTGKTWDRLQEQLSTAFSAQLLEEGLAENVSDWMVAYEPVWAIGTGETPKPAEVEAVHQQIQTFVGNGFGKGSPRVLYGGSVSEKNIEDFMKAPHIDGVLVGGASLSAETFFKIIELGVNAK